MARVIGFLVVHFHPGREALMTQWVIALSVCHSHEWITVQRYMLVPLIFRVNTSFRTLCLSDLDFMGVSV